MNSEIAVLRAPSPNRIICSRKDSMIVRTNLSACAFRFGDRGGNFSDFTPALPISSRNSAVNSGSRSWIRYRVPLRMPSAASVIAPGPHLDGKEVGRRDQFPMAAQELLPGGLAAALRRRFYAVSAQDVGDSGTADGVPDVGKRTLDPLIAPVAVLATHSDHQRFDFLWCCGRPGRRRPLPSYFCAISFRCQASSVCGVTMVATSASRPAQQFRFGRESAALIIAQTKSSPAQLPAQDAILLAEVINDLQLLLFHPAGEADQQEPERIQRLQHGIAHYRRPRRTPVNHRKFSRFQFSDPTR